MRPTIWYKKAISFEVLTPGRVVITRNASQYCEENGINAVEFLRRHVSGDWGTLAEEDTERNRASLKTKGMIMSSYKIGPDKLWIITDPGWKTTTILLPDDY